MRKRERTDQLTYSVHWLKSLWPCALIHFPLHPPLSPILFFYHPHPNAVMTQQSLCPVFAAAVALHVCECVWTRVTVNPLTDQRLNECISHTERERERERERLAHTLLQGATNKKDKWLKGPVKSIEAVWVSVPGRERERERERERLDYTTKRTSLNHLLCVPFCSWWLFLSFFFSFLFSFSVCTQQWALPSLLGLCERNLVSSKRIKAQGEGKCGEGERKGEREREKGHRQILMKWIALLPTVQRVKSVCWRDDAAVLIPFHSSLCSFSLSPYVNGSLLTILCVSCFWLPQAVSLLYFCLLNAPLLSVWSFDWPRAFSPLLAKAKFIDRPHTGPKWMRQVNWEVSHELCSLSLYFYFSLAFALHR